MTDDAPSAPAGWYPQADGSQRYWDGAAWTEHRAPAPGAQQVPPPVDDRSVEAADKRRGYIVIAVVVLVALVGFAFWSARPKSPTFAGGSVGTSSTSRVVYKVHGTATSVSWTVQTPTGTKQGDADVPLMNTGGTEGLQFTFPAGEFVYISAQNQGESGTVECIIEVDGVEVSRNASTGAYQIAQCDGQS